MSSNVPVSALVLAMFMVSSGARADDAWAVMSDSHEARSVSTLGDGFSSALDFAESDFEGLNASALTAHVFVTGSQEYAFGLALGQTEIGADRRHHAAVEAAAKANGLAFHAVAGRRFLRTGGGVFARLGLQVPLDAGMKFDLGMEYDSLSGREEIRVAFGPTDSSGRWWEPFFDAGGSRDDMHAIGGIRIYFGPRSRDTRRASDMLDAIPNAAASEIGALFKEGENDEESSPSETASSPPAPNSGLAIASGGQPPGRGNSAANAGNPSGSRAGAGSGSGAGAVTLVSARRAGAQRRAP